MLPTEAMSRNQQRQDVEQVKKLADKLQSSEKMRKAVKKALEVMRKQPGEK